jgi:hypothetical protein
MSKFNAGQSFADGDTVTGAKLNNIAGLLDIYTGLISEQTAMVATVSTADQLLIADVDNGDSGAANRVTVQKLLNDGLTNGTFTNLNLSGNFNVTQLSTLGTINNTRGTVGILNSTTGTIQSLTSSTANISQGSAIFTQGTIATLNSTTGTIGTLVATGTITGSTNVVNIGSGQIYKNAAGKVFINSTTERASVLSTCKLQVYDSSLGLASNADYTPQVFLHGASATAGAAPYFAAGRSRGSIETPLTVASGDQLGNIIFSGHDGTTFINPASILSKVDGAVTTGTVPSNLIFTTGSSTGIERMRIDSAGNVGIGTTSPATKLDVSGTISASGATGVGVNMLATGTGGRDYRIASTDNANGLGGGKFTIYDQTAGASRVLIDSSGNVGIGSNSTPVNKLEIVGSFGRGAPVTKTTDFTLAATENWIIVNKALSCIATLPSASSWTGREFTIKTIQAVTVVSPSANVVPINSTVAGLAILPATAGSWATLVSDGTNWVIMAQ